MFFIFYGHLVFLRQLSIFVDFMVIWYIFYPIWYIVLRKIWQPWSSTLLPVKVIQRFNRCIAKLTNRNEHATAQAGGQCYDFKKVFPPKRLVKKWGVFTQTRAVLCIIIKQNNYF
jgi:hypothetical protein